ncbi:MAG: hypothetical protein LAN71_03980 [Acidobacteriia bacterium]|nr:hypothetical protein [Terriglobia bacterium]
MIYRRDVTHVLSFGVFVVNSPAQPARDAATSHPPAGPSRPSLSLRWIPSFALSILASSPPPLLS